MKMFEIIERSIANFDSLSEEDKERFAGMCSILAACLVDGRKAVWMVDTDERLTIMSLHCDEFEMAQLVTEGYHSLHCAIMEEAPPKEEMN